MGIDQLKFQSVQLGYLKILQLVPVCPAWLSEDPATGHHRPKQQKQKKKIRGQASVRRALKPANHATCYISNYEMHEAVKGIGQQGLLINWQFISIEPLHPHSVSTGEIIGTTYLSAGHNVALSQVINHSVNQAQDVCMNAINKADGFYHERNHLVALIRTSLITRISDGGGATEARRWAAAVREVGGGGAAASQDWRLGLGCN
ncbi:hypothetical protein F511_35648 [Dorcoceras hygrometricum]|uniref:Uncharacterized protein n=1 Tax=Dorcoceras hygrometricum TaxID=472368 RepID=A0A2Z7ATF7_9LAMI|nr:hypothetical protein F511_35648 [Dorcoceras hygrometricum]